MHTFTFALLDSEINFLQNILLRKFSNDFLSRGGGGGGIYLLYGDVPLVRVGFFFAPSVLDRVWNLRQFVLIFGI